MHRHAKSWRKPHGFRRKVWDYEAMVGPEGYWGPWRNAIGLDEAGAETIARALDRIRDRIERFGMGPERFGLVHVDFDTLLRTPKASWHAMRDMLAAQPATTDAN